MKSKIKLKKLTYYITVTLIVILNIINSTINLNAYNGTEFTHIKLDNSYIKNNVTKVNTNTDIGEAIVIKPTQVSKKQTLEIGDKIVLHRAIKDYYEVSYLNNPYNKNKYFIHKDSVFIDKSYKVFLDNNIVKTKNKEEGMLKKDIKLYKGDEKITIKRGTPLDVKLLNNKKYEINYQGVKFEAPIELIVFKEEDVEVYQAKDISFNESKKEIQMRLVENATKRIGTPYLWGGTSDRHGFDCSGFTQTVYSDSGISIPKFSGDQAKIGKFVNVNSNLMVGDLIFFGKNNVVNHVGMYIGNNKFIHSSTNKGGVTIDSLSSPYVKNNFMFIKRILD